MKRWSAGLVLLGGLYGCAVDVATLQAVAPSRPSAQSLRTATSRGWRDGESCRLWILGIPFGLPQVDEAITDALAPVQGAYMRDVTVYSVHPIYVLYGWHCYHVRGEVFGQRTDVTDPTDRTRLPRGSLRTTRTSRSA
jgi:hypothetical protein